MTSHIFLMDTELQCFASLKVIETEAIHSPVFFCFNQNVHHYLERKGHTTDIVEKKSKGLFGQARALHKSIDLIKRHLADKSIIYIHRLDLIYTNIIIGTLVKNYDIEVRIIPEGTLNFCLEDASVKWSRRSKRWAARIGYGLTGLQKLEILGERVGTDMPIVTTAYSFAGLESPYTKSKVKYLSFLNTMDLDSNRVAKRALVVGQSMLNSKKTPKDVEQRVSDKILEVLTSIGVCEIDYVPHPRDKNLCLARDNYQEIKNPHICLEQYLVKKGYDIVISCCSTVLMTAKLIYGERIESIAVGTKNYPTTPHAIEAITKVFRQANVTMIDL